ncbi:MAG TPA: RiPP maturation radical SAM C-methyltransferase [Burkholderiales bacterium]|nr:RiPP maturation radical SAM C-methyltransferase [Burkholderiales bacterium]
MNARDASSDVPSATPVVLVLMPYADIARPSIALGTLKACLAQAGIGCALEYANLSFAEKLGSGMPEAPYLARLLGEWTFSAAAFPDHAGTSAKEALASAGQQFSFMPPAAFNDPRFVGSLERLRAYAPRFVDDVARAVLARRPRIVGCSSTFEQHCASLALLRRIRELDPGVITMIGGANCEAEMGWGTIRSFPWVDVVVSGEADELFAPLCQLLLDHGMDVPASMLPNGVLTQQHVRNGTFGPGALPVPRAVVEDVNSNPVPDYSDYMDALAASPLRGRVAPGMLVEFSRGCWWGQKHHCTFCGLNGGGMHYRAKSPERAMEELDALSSQSGVDGFMVVDNILDMSYLRTLLPELAARGAPYRLFFETKANLKREHVAMLARSGVVWIQPGIEAFHDSLLKLMDKGATAAINLQVLKYCREFGVYATWNLLYGFPGEDDAWHAEVAEWLPLCFHLQPPKCIGRVLYDRFSMYHQSPARYGLTLEPSQSYASVYPLPEGQIADLAYFFADQSPQATVTGPGVRALASKVIEWFALFERGLNPVLSMTVRGESIDIFDTRPCAPSRRVTLVGLDARVYLACEPAADCREVCRRLEADGSDPVAVQGALERLSAIKLLANLHGKYLALAVPGESPPLLDEAEFPGGSSQGFETFTSEVLDAFERRTRALAGEANDRSERTPAEIGHG